MNYRSKAACSSWERRSCWKHIGCPVAHLLSDILPVHGYQHPFSMSPAWHALKNGNTYTLDLRPQGLAGPSAALSEPGYQKFKVNSMNMTLKFPCHDFCPSLWNTTDTSFSWANSSLWASSNQDAEWEILNNASWLLELETDLATSPVDISGGKYWGIPATESSGLRWNTIAHWRELWWDAKAAKCVGKDSAGMNESHAYLHRWRRK